MGKILHLIPDEKVTDNVIENFSSVTSNNIFFILEYSESKKYSKIIHENVIRGNECFFISKNIDAEVDTIIVHGLNNVFAKLILEVDLKIKIAWIAWGFDIYNLPKIMDKLYAPQSRLYLNKSDPKHSVITYVKKNKFLRKIYYKKIKKTDDYYTIYEKAHSRIDFFCSFIYEDFELFSRHYQNKLLFQEIGYFSISQYLVGQNDLRINIKARNVLVGNSNSLENNHLDVFKILSKNAFLGDVIVPLSYGKADFYKETVLLEGKSLLKEKFHSLLDFMDRSAYLNILSDCSTAVFYHYRQQAMGNILALLYMGVRVYFSEKNPVFHYLKRIGIVVFNFDTDFEYYSNSILDVESQNINRAILDTLFHEDVIKRQHINLIDILNNVHKSGD
ncbi:TDP-N-acetylfucosamine:lipid II N-acetylfucosaminyltransferase [Flavobacterium sp. SM2513]|uniref:TDP-N-acetylfucosamine:lipid II N-acetylfucosaminyltransferase n=1 Tax=Flavobacterium sp. SM2513 TaxID=3424766 RepID=UPI003D7FA43B